MEDMHRFFHQTSVPSGVLSIGMVETINRLFDLLSAYCSRYPQVDLSLTAGVTERLLQHVLDVELDGAFVTGPISHPLIEQVQVFTEELVLVTKGSSFALEEVTGKALLLYNKGCGFRERLESWMKLEGLIPKKVMEFGTYETIIGGIAAGIGMTILPRSAVRHMAESGQVHLHAVPKPYRDVTTVFIRRKDAVITSTMQSTSATFPFGQSCCLQPIPFCAYFHGKDRPVSAVLRLLDALAEGEGFAAAHEHERSRYRPGNRAAEPWDVFQPICRKSGRIAERISRVCTAG